MTILEAKLRAQECPCDLTYVEDKIRTNGMKIEDNRFQSSFNKEKIEQNENLIHNVNAKIQELEGNILTNSEDIVLNRGQIQDVTDDFNVSYSCEYLVYLYQTPFFQGFE